MKRRDFMGLAGLTAISTLSGCSLNSATPENKQENLTNKTDGFNASLKQMRAKTKKRVVVIGGGFGGLNTASAIVATDSNKEIEVIVLERNQHYFVCPMSNTLLSGDSKFLMLR